MTLPPASITRDAWYTGVILIGPADDLKVCAGRSVWARAETASKATAAQTITARIGFIYTLLMFIPPSNARNLSTHGVARQSKRAAIGGSVCKETRPLRPGKCGTESPLQNRPSGWHL